MLKTFGYLISTLSVILLGIVAWKATVGDQSLRACLIAGMLASVLGMFCRWLSYEFEKKNRRREEARGGSASRTLGMQASQKGVGQG